MHPMLNIAVRAARRAGSIINRAALDGGGGLKVTSKRAKDFVTQVDQAAEQAIIDIVRKSYPEHGLLAEESGEGQAQRELVWVIGPPVDPATFTHPLPQHGRKPALQIVGASSRTLIQPKSPPPRAPPASVL